MYEATHENPALRREVRRLVEWAKSDGLADHYAGKRRTLRFRSLVRLALATDPDQSDEFVYVHVHNISEGGFACWSKRSIDEHTEVFVRAEYDQRPGAWLPATVTHCTSGIRGFLIGARFTLDTENG